MKIAVDLEDVIVNTNAVFIEKLNSFIEQEFKQSNLEFSEDDVSEWGMTEISKEMARLMNWQDEISNKFFYGEGKWGGYIPMTEEIWREENASIPVMEDNISEKIKRLNNIPNSKVHLVTARKRVDDSIRKKLNELDILNGFQEIVVESEKHKLDYDFYIDDNPTLTSKLEDGKVHLVRERPWNKNREFEKPHRNIRNLKESAEVIQNLGSKI